MRSLIPFLKAQVMHRTVLVSLQTLLATKVKNFHGICFEARVAAEKDQLVVHNHTVLAGYLQVMLKGAQFEKV